ncbi:hypothetical protein [Butyrivibrio sp. JL13D10]|uniref:hypothetical protein n=1 Tax=Butyrivibrio sp. JL13D10 TaxID=3236815 RepID=UPI0038B44335
MSDKELKNQLSEEELDEVNGGVHLSNANPASFVNAIFTNQTDTQTTNLLQKGGQKPTASKLGAAKKVNGIHIATPYEAPAEGKWT